MCELNSLFRKRIGISQNKNITFEKLDYILEQTAINIPFENLCIMENKISDINKENLINKILVNKEGGLCYELNSIFYFFLIENGFDASLVRGVIYDNINETYSTIGRTHVAILVTHKNQTYLIDTGFGGNLPLKPVPITGEPVTSNNGEFRVNKGDSEFGNYALEMKLKHKDTNWKIGYAFDSKKLINDVSEFNEIQTIIAKHQESPFNKKPLITRLTSTGNLTLTDTSFTQWIDGIDTKEEIDHAKFKELLKKHFGI
ncbi:arylamine N-acetyltransferase [Oceanobacillus caeni]|uniref:Arylamine N-acetyltransferase n=1 Tax=Oceanobacillus caeni TaxID=405946 RepID=A0ABR5MHD3_9BACI|nr:arylamine N-acetyltransferase [Oceanobacillus caeni]KKE79415.1 arylamine N-acetyltransferase [Bacilli bacterium VT-13-104]PZD88290.1 arylamine N-acetyltransferase [Bacilli bacterium]KPH73216.1 arylamine N-acetyltransferase [Oceanobacillus caeni]MBU8791200.1 arylamine N-acetyltransferase [Oceanobacillus caeni]MCR1834024.1 arylamine N-acetyltransferase [Oceanobacillus caeni]